MNTPTTEHPTSTSQRENWDDVKARLQQRWGQMDNGDFTSSGTWDDLLARIQAKTGEARAVVEEYATKALADAKVKAADWQSYVGVLVSDAKTRAAEVRTTAADTLHQKQTAAQDAVTQQVAAAESHVRANPVTSLAYAFGLGALVGVLLGSRRS